MKALQIFKIRYGSFLRFLKKRIFKRKTSPNKNLKKMAFFKAAYNYE